MWFPAWLIAAAMLPADISESHAGETAAVIAALREDSALLHINIQFI